MDASEYEPQVVELPVETAEKDKDSEGNDDDGGGGSGEERKITGFAPKKEKSVEKKGIRTLYEGLSDEERMEIWVKKLHQMQQKYLDSLSEQEREAFLKRLDV